MKNIVSICIASLFINSAATSIAIAAGEPQVANPTPYVLKPFGKFLGQLKSGAGLQPAGAVRDAPEVQLEMNVRYLDRQIYNPSSGNYDKVRLRGYEDVNGQTGGTAALPIVGPTIDTFPGQTIRVTLNNMLPADSTCGIGNGGSVNIPHCFNGTNLHSHGLWINPSGNGDNVLITIRPRRQISVRV